jgi:hypothetical protein
LKKNERSSNLVDLGKVLLNTSYLEDSIIDSTNHSFMDESLISLSLQNENNVTISEILNQNEYEKNNEITELWNRKKSSTSGSRTSSSSSISIDDLISKRKIKKYAIEADLKLLKNFDEIKSKLAHQVNKDLFFIKSKINFFF